MKHLLIGALLLLASCAPTRLESIQGLVVEGWASNPHGSYVLVYDPDTDELAWIDTFNMKVTAKYEHWMQKTKEMFKKYNLHLNLPDAPK